MLRRADPRFALRNAVTGQRVERCRNSPSLILDFINQDYRTGLGSHYERHSFSDLITLTRAGSGMRWNADGNLELVAANEPRFDHDPVTRLPLGLLVEEQRTNLVPDSVASTSDWSLVGGSWSDETLNAFNEFPGLRIASGGAAFHRVNSGNLTVSAGQLYAITVFVRPGSVGTFRVEPRDPTGANSSLLSGTLGGAVGVNSVAAGDVTYVGQIECPDGFLVFMTFTPNFTGTSLLGVGPNTGTSGEFIYVLGAQVEAGSFSSSYIPATSPTTRPADICFRDMASEFNSSQGTWVVEGSYAGLTPGKNEHIANLSANSNNDRFSMFYSGPNDDYRAQVFSGGGFQGSLNAPAPAPGSPFRSGFCWGDSGDMLISTNGSVENLGGAAGPVGLSRMYFGNNAIGALKASAVHIHKAYYWPENVGAAALSGLTA